MPQLLYYSTNLKSAPVTFREALLKGQAPDKGLFMPSQIPQIAQMEIEIVLHGWPGIRAVLPVVVMALRMGPRSPGLSLNQPFEQGFIGCCDCVRIVALCDLNRIAFEVLRAA